MKTNFKYYLILIIVISVLLRIYKLDFPDKYVFDEVYHAYTAKEYLKGNKDAWSPWGKSTEDGTAFEWLHPPIAKEVMTGSMFTFHSTNAWAWRLPGVIFGVLAIYFLYILASLLFKDKKTALLSAFVLSLDGLLLTQSRTGMNDIYLVTLILLSTIFFVRKKYLVSSIFMGLSLSTKWPGIFLLLIFIPILIRSKEYKKIIYFLLVPPLVYLLSYSHYFLMGYTLNDFIELHRQIWWYQTNLKATHDYSSPAWSWPLNLYPVWYFVGYKDNLIANIFASGNPILYWLGSASIVLTIWDAFKKRSVGLFIIILGFFAFWLPWLISPRIMFFYHFSPSVAFMCLSLAYQMNKYILKPKSKNLVLSLIILTTLSFILLYPFLVGIYLPKNLMMLFFLTNITKNPFI